MTMLEKMARAMCEAQGLEPDQIIEGDWHTFSPHPVDFSVMTPDMIYRRPRWEAYVKHARAVLTALREGSPDMFAAGAHASNEGIDDAWRAMIDHVLMDETDRLLSTPANASRLTEAVNQLDAGRSMTSGMFAFGSLTRF